MTINVDSIAQQVSVALDEAEERLAKLRAERAQIQVDIREQVEAVIKIKRLYKAVTPRGQDGDNE